MSRTLTLLWLITIATISFAHQSGNTPQQRPKADLSGRWTLDLTKSTLAKDQKEGLTKYVLTILQRETDIKIVRTIRRSGQESVDELVYYTDGRADPRLASQNIYVKTTWRKNKLYQRITSSIGSPFLSFQTVTEDEWRLSNDGRTLTRTVHTSSSGMPLEVPPTAKYVFFRH
jgi:hypothetical protein